jgi:hypothetical protein
MMFRFKRLCRCESKLIACFGNARLTEEPDGSYTLRGGSANDQVLANEWISLFLHEAVPRRELEASGVSGCRR